MKQKKFKTGEFRYKVDTSGKVKWDFPGGISFSKIADNFFFFHPKFHYLYATHVTITHHYSSEFNLFFSDFFPIHYPVPTQEKKSRIHPQIRIIYPASEIETLLLLSEEILGKYADKIGLLEKEEKKFEAFKLTLTTTVSPFLPMIYANAGYFFFEASNNAFRILFGEIFSEGIEAKITYPNSEKEETLEKMFFADIGIIIPGRVFRSMVEAIKNNIARYKEKLGSLPSKE